MSQRAIGYLLCIIQAVLYSTMGVVGKFMYGTGLAPEQVILLRFSMTVVLLGVFLLITRRECLLSHNPYVYLQGFCFAATAVTYFFAVQYLTAGLTTVIFYGFPAVVAFISVFVFHEHIGIKQYISLLLTIIGLFLISGLLIQGSVKLSPIGLLFAVGSNVTFALYMIVGQKVVEKEGVLTATFTFCLVSLVGTAIVFFPYVPTLVTFTPQQYALGLAMAVFNTILPVVILLEGIKRIGANLSSLISISETPFALFFAYLVLGEVLTGMQAVGTILIIIATIIALTIKKPVAAGDGTVHAED